MICVPKTLPPCQIFQRVRSQKDGTYLWRWCSRLGSPLAGLSARDNCPLGERLPDAGPGVCWEEGLVSGHEQGCSGFHHLGGWLWLSLWPVETLQPHYSRMAQPLLREPWGNKTEWIWGQCRWNYTTQATDKGLLSQNGSEMKAISPRDKPCVRHCVSTKITLVGKQCSQVQLRRAHLVKLSGGPALNVNIQEIAKKKTTLKTEEWFQSIKYFVPGLLFWLILTNSCVSPNTSRKNRWLSHIPWGLGTSGTWWEVVAKIHSRWTWLLSCFC